MATTLEDVECLIQKFWSPIFTKQLRESLLLGSLVNKDYNGSILKQGDRVTVGQVNAPVGDLLTIGTNADTFQTSNLAVQCIDIVADKRAVAAYDFDDLVQIQSLVGQDNPEVIESLNYAIEKVINDYLYSLVAPSTANPDHLITGVTDFNASQLAACRTLAAQALWRRQPGWYCLPDPQYFGDLLNAMTLTSSDYVREDAPVVAGQIATRRFGFNIFEDNSRGPDYALLFHPDFMHLVMQTEARIKISDKHAMKQFGYVMSVDIVFGARLGIDGDKKHIVVRNT